MKKTSRNPVRLGLCLCVVLLVLPAGGVDNPLSAKVEIAGVQNYSGSPLPKPNKILVYDFTISPANVQVDKTQEVRLRHLIEGDQNPAKVGENAVKELSNELIKALKATGIPVEHATGSAPAPANTLLVQGSFLEVREGDKAERVVMGMGEGSAEVQTRVQAQFKGTGDPVIFSAFQTNTTLTKNVGAVVPAAAGMNPAGAATKSVVTDRKKTVGAYSSRTADAVAKQIATVMAEQGWIKADAKVK